MIKKHTYIFSVFLLFACLFSAGSVCAQQIQNLSDSYYYNNFNGGAIGSAFTQRGATASLGISGQSTNNLTPTSGYCLSSIGNSTAGGFDLSFLTNGMTLNDETYGFEWTFLYKNTGGNTDNSDIVGNNENAWKYWFLADGSNLDLSKGYFLTQVGTTLYLRYRYDNYPDGTHYNNLITFDLSSIGGNNTTYAIRVQRLKRGGQFVWHLFVDPYSATVKQGSTERGGTGAYNGDIGTYANSALLSSSTTNGRFLFDEMKMYSMRLIISGASETSNGISNPLFAGQIGAIVYGLQLQTRGLFDMYQIRIENTGSITSILQQGTMKLMKSVDNFYGSADDTFITGLEFYDGAVQKYGFSDRFYSIGNSNGSNATVCYYYITANVKENASLTNTYTFVGAPVLQSESAQINYVANGDVEETEAPEAGSGVLYDWVGGVSSDWLKPENWSPLGQPGDKDVARIGVVTFTNQPVLSGTTLVGNVTLGTAKAITLTVNGTLNVTSTITQQNAPNADVTTVLAGSGTLAAANIIIGDRTPGTTVSGTANSTLLDVTLNTLNISDAVILNGAFTPISAAFRMNNAGLKLHSGKVLTTKEIRTNNLDDTNISSVYLDGGTLRLTGVNPFATLAELGKSYVLSPSASGSTIEYFSDAAQNIYPQAAFSAATVFPASPTAGYSNLKFSGTGVKTIMEGTLDVKGTWESSGGKIDFLTENAAVNFSGAGQTITDNGSDGGNGILFKNVTFSGGNTKTLAGTGKFSVTVGGVLTVSASTTLASAGKLTLKSDATGFANVAPLTSGATISGDVNEEIFFTGGNGNRGTRLISPTINDNLLPTGSKYLQQLKSWMVITGPGEAQNGFDPGNSAVSEATTLTMYNEPATMASAANQYTKVDNLNNGTVPIVKPGTGVYLFYRGDRSNYTPGSSSSSAKLSPAYIPESFSPVFTGVLNQGNVAAAITNTNNNGDNYNGYNLVGNPYPATIDFEKVYTANSSNIANEIRIILPGGGMMSRKNVGGIVSVINAPDILVSQYLQPGQGFYIRKTSVGAGNLNFTEANKAAEGVNPDRLLTAPAQKGLFASLGMGVANSSYMVSQPSGSSAVSFYFNLKDAANADEAVIIFKEGFEANFDQNDAPYLSGSTVTLSSLSADNKPLAMNYMPDLGDVQEVKLNINAAASGQLSLNFTSIDALGRFKATLKDNYLNTSTDIKANPVYTFAVDKTNAATYGAGRFVLQFEQGPPLAIDLTAFTAVQQESSVVLNWTTAKEESSERFDIERSADGTTFEKIGEIAGAGSMYTPKVYQWIDSSPLNGINYYRLKQVYSDETSSNSGVVNITYTKPIHIDLTEFYATKQHASIDLNWITRTEESSVRFEIEKSGDGVNFIKIGEKAGAGNSSSSISYAFTDNNPLDGENDYRLKQIYADGTFSYSEIRSVVFANPLPVDLYSFTLTKQPTLISLNWATATETASVKFEIERTGDGVAFAKIGELTAAGNSTSLSVYAFDDTTPLVGMNSYRLKLLYENGTFAYTEVKSVRFNNPLQINLSEFTAGQQDATVVLNWTTVNEEMSDHFEIESSADGVNFTKFGTIAGAGDSATPKSYTITDNNPAEGDNYYRIKQVYTDGTSSYSETKTISFIRPAHINLASFTAERQGRDVALSFVTASEENSLSFEIERSADGNNFTKIGTLTAAGNASAAKTYNFLDKNPLSGNNYYRIKQVNINFESDYSDKRLVNFRYDVTYGISALMVYPNPSSEMIEVNVANVPTKLTIYSLAGRPLKTAVFAAGEPVKQRVSDLSAGMYIVEVKNTTDNKILGTAKFFKN